MLLSCWLLVTGKGTQGVGPAKGFFHCVSRFMKCALCSIDIVFWCVDTAVGIGIEF